MTHNDINRQIPDYVLGLLSPRQLTTVERHVSRCSACQQTIVRERKFVQLVRSTVSVTTRPETAHLRSLLPAIPKQRQSGLLLHGWQKQLAPVVMILLMILGGFMINRMLPAGSVPSLVATAHAATATSTYTPTATLAQSLPENLQTNNKANLIHSYSSNAVVPVPSPPSDRPLETPVPLPTPVAAIRQVSAQ